MIFDMRDKTRKIRAMMLGLDAPVRLSNGRMVPAVNLDNAATTPALKPVMWEIDKQLLYYGSIGRGKGQKSEHSTRVYAEGGRIIKRFVGADSDQYTAIYTNCTTDGMNKLASALITSPNDVVISTRMEHHANDLPWRERARTLYAEVAADGRLIVEDIERLLIEQGGAVKIVTVTAASNVTGYINDIHRIAALAHRHGAMIVVDGAQIVAHRKVRMLGDTPEQNIDFLVFSAHKMYAPFGGGALVGRTDVLNQHLPMFYGGGMVDGVCDDSVAYSPAPDRYEAGSPNYPGVVGMLKAIETLERIGFDYIEAHEQRLLRCALVGLSSIPGVTLYGDSARIDDRVGIVAFNLSGLTPTQTADQLAGLGGIAVRHAAFCAHPYVRRLTGEPEGPTCVAPTGMVRASFGMYNDESDVDCLLETVETLLCRSQRGRLFDAAPSFAGGHALALDPAATGARTLALPNDRG